MKQLFLVAILALITANATPAQTVYHLNIHVQDVNGNPRSGIWMELSPNTTGSAPQGTTDANGDLTLTASSSILDCVNELQEANYPTDHHLLDAWPPFNGNDYNISFTTYDTSEAIFYPNYNIVDTSLSLSIAHAVAYYIDKTFDSNAGAYVLRTVDSFLATGCNGNNLSPSHAFIPNDSLPQSGHLLIKTAMSGFYQDSLYYHYLPTYKGLSLLWSGAATVDLNDTVGTPAEPIDYLVLITGTNPGGPAFIPGSVLNGAGKGVQLEPAPNRTLILTTEDYTPVTYRISDNNGNFYFDNLAYGTYKMFIDSWGKTTDTVTIVLSATEGAVVNYIEDAHSATGNVTQTTLAVAQATQAMKNLSLAPNPAYGSFAIQNLEKVPGSKDLVVMNVAGQAVYRAKVADGQPALVTTSGWPAGLYAVRVVTAAGTMSMKVEVR